MSKKHIPMILTGVGILLVFFSLILLCVSADFVGDVEDRLGYDIELRADMVREASRISDGLPDSIARHIDGGFGLFALKTRGWCFGFGFISLAAAAVMLALEVNSRLGAMALELVREFCAAVSAGFGNMAAGINDGLSRWKLKKWKSCPGCGARCADGDRFCSSCGKELNG